MLQSASYWLHEVPGVAFLWVSPVQIRVSYKNNLVCVLQNEYRTGRGDYVLIKNRADLVEGEYNTTEEVVQAVCNLMGVEVPNAPEEQLGADMLSALHRRLLRLERRAYR